MDEADRGAVDVSNNWQKLINTDVEDDAKRGEIRVIDYTQHVGLAPPRIEAMRSAIRETPVLVGRRLPEASDAGVADLVERIVANVAVDEGVAATAIERVPVPLIGRGAPLAPLEGISL